MINDLLREQIPVYWTTTNGTASIKEIRSDKEIVIKSDVTTISYYRFLNLFIVEAIKQL